MVQNKISLYLVTGFLGAGKTTLMKKLLFYLKNRKTAVIMNEFGSRGVDRALLDQRGYEISEINGGSIFCTCKSDAFLDALWALCEHDIDILLVETSGMADPSSMPAILSVAAKKTQRLDYRGCITVASASNIHKLLQTSLFVQNQVRYADILVLNKTDLATDEQLLSREEMIRQFNPICPIYKTSYCDLSDISRLLDMQADYSEKSLSSKLQVEGSSATRQFTLEFSSPVEKEALMRFLHSFQNDIFRVKGFVNLKNNTTVLVDGVQENIRLHLADAPSDRSFLVFIYPNDKPLKYLIQRENRDGLCFSLFP